MKEKCKNELTYMQNIFSWNLGLSKLYTSLCLPWLLKQVCDECGLVYLERLSLLPQEIPTVTAMGHFDPSSDAAALRKAMKGFGTDEAAIIAILSRRTSDQRQQIMLKYQQSYGRVSSYVGECGLWKEPVVSFSASVHWRKLQCTNDVYLVILYCDISWTSGRTSELNKWINI